MASVHDEPRSEPVAGVPGEPPPTRDSLVDLRCSVVVFRGPQILVLRRDEHDDWVIPGGRPHEGESMVSCARREVLEETGLEIQPRRCLFVLEVTDPAASRRVVELVFLGVEHRPGMLPGGREPGRHAEFVDLHALRGRRMHPPLAGYLAALSHGTLGEDGGRGAAYLGNLWRPDGPAWSEGP